MIKDTNPHSSIHTSVAGAATATLSSTVVLPCVINRRAIKTSRSPPAVQCIVIINRRGQFRSLPQILLNRSVASSSATFFVSSYSHNRPRTGIRRVAAATAVPVLLVSFPRSRYSSPSPPSPPPEYSSLSPRSRGSSQSPTSSSSSSSSSGSNREHSRAERGAAAPQQPVPHLPRKQPRIQVASLLADPHTRSYHLEVVQQPQKTAEFGNSNLSRLPITPPIIVQLIVRDPSGNSVVPEAELPFLIAHLSLYSEDGSMPLDMGSDIGRGNAPPLLYGNLVSSVDQLEDLQGNLGLFYLFPDVSIRWRGRYQLGITLTRLSLPDSSQEVPTTNQEGRPNTVLAQVRTRMFEVVALNQYTAAAPTRLTQCFLRQGANLLTYVPSTGSSS